MIITPTLSITRFDCWTCRALTRRALIDSGRIEEALGMMPQFIICPTCGNKRCPRATWHENDCTGSNLPGQTGSRF